MTLEIDRYPSVLRSGALAWASIVAVVLALGTVSANAQSPTADAGTMGVEKAPAKLVVLRAADYNAFSRVRARPRQPLGEAPGAVLSNFDVTYIGFTPQAEAAFQAAVDIWASVLESSQTIKVVANWTPLSPGVLGSAGASNRFRNFPGAPVMDFWFPSALADALGGVDQDPADFDIMANFASNRGDWYLGTDGNPPADQFDLLTVVMHELGHGLGFSGSMLVDDGTPPTECNGVNGVGCFGLGNPVDPFIFDRYSETGAGTALTSLAQNSVSLGNQLTGGNIFFDSPGATGANGGIRPELYAPNPFEFGSSYSHLDETVFPAGDPDSLMTPQLAMAEHIGDPGDIALCMFEDMGWRTTATCSGGGLIGPTVLFNQAGIGACLGAAIPSQFFTDFGSGAEAADDFVVPPGEDWSIETVVTPGIYSGGGGPADSVNVTIYNNGASPGTVACSRPAQNPAAGLASGSFTIDLSSPCDLGPGTYWLSVQPVMAFGAGSEQWFWAENNFSSNGDTYEWQDTADLFSTGCTSWTPHGTCGIGSMPDLCFGFLGPPGQAADIFADGFESGNTSLWSAAVP